MSLLNRLLFPKAAGLATTMPLFFSTSEKIACGKWFQLLLKKTSISFLLVSLKTFLSRRLPPMDGNLLASPLLSFPILSLNVLVRFLRKMGAVNFGSRKRKNTLTLLIFSTVFRKNHLKTNIGFLFLRVTPRNTTIFQK